ncbi:MAG: hypothetical protein WC011_00850 [Candidatus Paceibacterota bacterium]
MNFKFENLNLIKPIPLSENPKLMKHLHEKKAKIVDQFRPKEMDFVDIYPESEILADLEEMRKIEENFHNNEEQKYKTELSSLLEAVLADQIESNNWLGENTEVVPASRYDDIKYGVDIVSIYREEDSEEYLGLGVDVAFANDKRNIISKLDGIKLLLKNGLIPKLKYFEDPSTGEHKELLVPKVVVGTRQSSAEKLLKTWGGESADRNKKLANDPMQSKIILESMYQINYFRNYLNELIKDEKNLNKKNKYQSIQDAYEKMYVIFSNIYQEKEEIIKSHINEISDDIVYETILEYTKS